MFSFRDWIFSKHPFFHCSIFFLTFKNEKWKGWLLMLNSNERLYASYFRLDVFHKVKINYRIEISKTMPEELEFTMSLTWSPEYLSLGEDIVPKFSNGVFSFSWLLFPAFLWRKVRKQVGQKQTVFTANGARNLLVSQHCHVALYSERVSDPALFWSSQLCWVIVTFITWLIDNAYLSREWQG